LHNLQKSFRRGIWRRYQTWTNFNISAIASYQLRRKTRSPEIKQP